MSASPAFSPPASPSMDRFALATELHHTFMPGPLGPRSVVLDLGASTAGFSQAVNAMCGCLCHAVEAMPRNYAAIAETPSVRKHHYAVCGADGPIALNIADAVFHWGSVKLHGNIGSTGTVTVPGITLPTLMARLGLAEIDLMKVDIEGAEIAMFDATPDAFLRRIAQITIEFHDFEDASQGSAVRRALSRLTRIGFDALVMTRRFHGDVMLLNRERLGVTATQRLYFRTLAKYGRGAGRVLSRLAGGAR